MREGMDEPFRAIVNAAEEATRAEPLFRFLAAQGEGTKNPKLTVYFLRINKKTYNLYNADFAVSIKKFPFEPIHNAQKRMFNKVKRRIDSWYLGDRFKL